MQFFQQFGLTASISKIVVFIVECKCSVSPENQVKRVQT